MKVLFIAHRLPFPPNKGDKIRAYNILRHLAENHEVHLVTHIDDAADLEYLDAAREAVASLSYERIDRTPRAWKALISIFSGRSISQEYFYSAVLQSRVDVLAKEHDFDVVFCSSSPTAEYVYRSRTRSLAGQKPVKIMDFIDIDSVKWQQYADDSSLAMRWVYTREARKLAGFERKIAADFDSMLVVSPNEAALFPGAENSHKVKAIGNGVDLEYFSPGEAGEPSQPTLVFVGMMDYRPNIDGMQWFIESIFPLIRQSVPGCLLQIVGGRPSATVLSWNSIDNVEVTGFVDDVRDYVRGASVSIVPLRIARGIQNKVLEAMAIAKAIVATPHAIEGIEASHGQDVIVAKTSAEFAEQVVALLGDPATAARIGQSARNCVVTKYSWQARLRELDAMLGNAQ
jgi:sugar transferase (PEP-CTERM/EpsH1 system associated)